MAKKSTFNRILSNIINRKYDNDNGEYFFVKDLMNAYKLNGMKDFAVLYESAWIEARDKHENLVAVLKFFDKLAKNREDMIGQ